ncbi:nucleotide exchange factor GrpE [Roseomonas xinghualingensis]|uniref:nucleotide exchange factor GrpE n=1 Tax=Roseomonas xinghualingensis TaxID=2986475 RepID=UPI0021F19360|nr:nucleotide exchange factor GrpE [Roseomonas sp. SXEYE001]MCV4206062.1 nucleotide exchange factor GrpE [Roseomonas sp. SXEYE001]
MSDTPNEARSQAADAQSQPGAIPEAEAREGIQGTEVSAQELAAQLAEMRDKWLRSEAEMQNLRNRHKRELEDARNYAVTKFARDVADTAENLRRGLDALPAEDAEDGPVTKLRAGFEGVERAFLAMLERHGVKSDNPTGKPFDPELHQAMAEQPAPEGVEPGTVITAWTPAWTINGRLLKPAMVVVAGKPA